MYLARKIDKLGAYCFLGIHYGIFQTFQFPFAKFGMPVEGEICMLVMQII